MLSFMEVTDSIQEVVTAMSQEILAFVLFTVSFWCLKNFNGRRAYLIKKDQALRKEQAVRVKKQAFCSEASPKLPARSNQAIRAEKAQVAEARIMTLLEAQEFTAALNAYRGYEREGLDRHFRNEAMYIGFIQSAVRLGKIDVIERMLKIMCRNRLTPSIDFWHSTLKMLSSRKLYSFCVEVFASYGHMLPDDKVIFSCLINAAFENGVPEKAVPMLHRYQKCGLKTAADYITAFRVYAALHDAESAEKLFLEMEAEPTSLLVNLVLSACTNAQQPERAMAVLQKAREMYGETVESLVDTISYNTVIWGFVACGLVDKSISCFEDMQKWNVEPDDVTLTSLLEITRKDKSGAITDRLVTVVLEADRSYSSPDAATFNLLIKALIREDRLQKALQIYAHMLDMPRSCRSRPTIATYSILIKALVDIRVLEQALHMVVDMEKQGVAPDEVIFTNLLDGCCLVGNHDLGKRIFTDMLARGVKPSGYTLTMLVKLYGRGGDLEGAYKLVEGWEDEHGLKPSVIHYTCIMSGCLRNRSYDLAWAAYKLMERHNIAPDATLMTTLIPAMAASGAFDRVVYLTRLALKRPGGVGVPTPLLRSVLGQMMAAPGAEKHVEAMTMLMQLSGIPVRSA